MLAGGQSLIPMLNLRLARFEALIDIGRIESLRRIERVNGHVAVGGDGPPEHAGDERRDPPRRAAAGRRHPADRPFPDPQPGHASAARSPTPTRRPSIRPWRSPSMPRSTSPGPPAGGRCRPPTSSPAPGRRRWRRTRCSSPCASRSGATGRGFAVEEVARRHGDFAIAGCACGVQVEDGRIGRAAIALFGVACDAGARRQAPSARSSGPTPPTVDAARDRSTSRPKGSIRPTTSTPRARCGGASRLRHRPRRSTGHRGGQVVAE